MNNNYEQFLINVFYQTRKTNKEKYEEEVAHSVEVSEVYKGIAKEISTASAGATTFINLQTSLAGWKRAVLGKTAILNFADGCTPGGWPEHGCRTQEENICRVSTLYDIIINPKFREDYYDANIKVNHPRSMMGLSTGNILYVKDVVVYKDGKTFENIKPITMDVITCPAPSVKIDDDVAAYQLYLKRIEGIIKSAIINDVEYLVLGAWGCGAFNQNPYLIAGAFVDVLNVYGSYFKGIDMAFVPCAGFNGRGRNYQIFKEVFEEYYKGEIVEE